MGEFGYVGLVDFVGYPVGLGVPVGHGAKGAGRRRILHYVTLDMERQMRERNKRERERSLLKEFQAKQRIEQETKAINDHCKKIVENAIFSVLLTEI